MDRIKKCQQLNDKHILILKQIKSFIAEKGYAPSYRELADLTGIKSTSVVYALICDLEDLEYVKHQKKIARSIRV